MATRQHSNARKTRKGMSISQKRSDWAAWMNGASPEWLRSREAMGLAQVFGGRFPGWLIESEPWLEVTPERFRFYRKSLLGLTTEQCAAYLHLHRSTICRWEAGEADVSHAAFEALRLTYQTAAQRLSHKHWDGWFIERNAGALVSPDVGKLKVLPEEINSLPKLYHRISILEASLQAKAKEVADLQAENIALRSSDKSRQVTEELEAMQARIGELVASVRTAEIIDFKPPAEQRRASL